MENKRLREQRLYVLGNNGVHRIRVSCAPGLPVLACGCSSLAQLHQLRGRVGRGKHQSYCVLVTSNRNPETRERLKTLTRTTDGFRIAEEDLKLRGPGDFFGQRQHGLPGLKVADLGCDTHLLQEAQEAADALLERDPDLTGCPATAGRVTELFTQAADTLN